VSDSPDRNIPAKRAIEEDFPIVEINRLAVPERNSFKPIYQIHKWFARRASCVFRAILLGALKPAGTNIMEEFYKDHSKDPDTNGKVVLDPFMGGGTTVVEALRLGCKVIGIDLNPVAWFIVKTQVEPVDLSELEAAFQRLANRVVPWSGKPLRETLLDLYKTTPPWIADEVCGLPDSDIIYTFWAKSAICTSKTCLKQVPLFSDYIIAAKSPSIRYYSDCKCPKCDAEFDWEIEPASLIADPRLMFHGNAYSGGVGRSNARWTYAHEEGGVFVCQGKTIWKKDGKITESSPEWIHVLRQHQIKTGMLQAGHVCCPNCNEIVRPRLTSKKKKRKKVPLTVLLCPETEDVFQWRGELGDGAMVTSPAGFIFDPRKGNVPGKGRFVCPHCGHNDAIIESIRGLPENQLLPLHAYGLQAYEPGCDPANDPSERTHGSGELFRNGEETEEADETDESDVVDAAYSGPYVSPTQNLIWKQKGKFYARHAPIDQARDDVAVNLWRKHHDSLPYPKSEIPPVRKQNRDC
jgi:putative DNA methylase